MPWSATQLLADLVRLSRGGGPLGPSTDAPNVQLDIPISVPLDQLTDTERFYRLDRQESYFRKLHHANKAYDWNGQFNGFKGEPGLPPGYVVPYNKRRPAARYDLASIVVNEFTALLFGEERFPDLHVPGDEDAEDACKTLCSEGGLPAAMAEGRNLGGALGTNVISFAFIDGVLRFEVHNAKHCTVLRWADEHTRRPAAVLKSYAYPRQVWDPDAKRIREVMYYYARYWDEEREVVWEPIPARVAKLPNWHEIAKKNEASHAFGFSPIYWIQNIRDSSEPDGEGDYEGLEGNFDEVDQLLSSSTTGTKVNTDPTLVIKMERALAGGDPVVRKGNGTVIFAKDGADYLSLKGDAMKAAQDQLEKLRGYTLQAAHVVLPDSEKLSGSAQSAAAMRIVYRPMLARAGLLRTQYGNAIKMIMRDVLRAARIIEAAPEVMTDEGPVKPRVFLPPREVPGTDGKPSTFEERSLGESDHVTLNWGPFFPPTWVDIKDASAAALQANGNKPVISQRTAVAATQQLWGVTDVAAELEQIHEEGEEALDMMNRQMSAEGPPGKPLPPGSKKAEDEPPADPADDEDEEA